MYKNKGFTLIELLIVIGIIAILAAAVIITIIPGERLAEARDATRARHLNALESALYVYAIDNEAYPAAITDTLTEICNTNLSSPNCTGLIDLSATDITIPVDPQGSDNPNGIGYRVALIGGRLYFDALKLEGTGSSPPVVLFWEVPIGSEAYDKDGNLVVSLEESGEISTQEAGMIVFRTAKDYGEIAAVPDTYEVLVVAGGGGGARSGSTPGAGGSAGGLVYRENYYISNVSVGIVVGDGGNGRTGSAGIGQNGDNSLLNDIVAIGGGYGNDGYNNVGGDGGSGGGGAGTGGAGDPSAGTALQPLQPGNSEGYGNNGGLGYLSSLEANRASGGGGGAGSAGTAASSKVAGNGGDGLEIFGFYYAGGGGGTSQTGTNGLGGSGVGGNGKNNGVAGNGLENTGSGGGGTTLNYNAGNGGSGIIIIRWGGYSHNYDPTQ